MHDLQSSTNENAEQLASFPDPRFRIVSEWPTTRELMTTRAFIGSNPPTRRHYFRFARHSALKSHGAHPTVLPAFVFHTSAWTITRCCVNVLIPTEALCETIHIRARQIPPDGHFF
jgi:hypothetical protein